ncbi:MAG: glycosyltransferase family 4 protein [Bacteroidetes bacterium]|nr:glycosyltransferase family 4 protein [Bacteroidota bacterium]
MKLLLVHHKNQRDIGSFSGTAYFMTRAIKRVFGEVREYDAPEPEQLLREVHEGDFRTKLAPYGTGLRNYLTGSEFKADCILCIGGTTCIPFYDHTTPIVYWHDCTWHTILQSYADKRRFEEFKKTFANFWLWDQAVLKRSALAIFSSAFIADACTEHYRIDSGKVRVIPFGANIFDAPVRDRVESALGGKLASRTLNLTFLGKDWKRKGLQDAYRLTLLLNSMGISTQLNVIGCEPAIEGIYDSRHVRIWGRFDKSDEAQFARFEQILFQTHFLVHPAASEPYGIALCEANAYGIPVIGTTVEGLMTIVKNGVNGYLFEPGTFVKDAAVCLANIFRQMPHAYATLSGYARQEYEERLNWDTGVLRLREELSIFG